MTPPLDMLQGLPGRLEKSKVVEGAYLGSSTLHCTVNLMERVGFLLKTLKLSNTVFSVLWFLPFMWCIFLLSAPSFFMQFNFSYLTSISGIFVTVDLITYFNDCIKKSQLHGLSFCCAKIFNQSLRPTILQGFLVSSNTSSLLILVRGHSLITKSN